MGKKKGGVNDSNRTEFHMYRAHVLLSRIIIIIIIVVVVGGENEWQDAEYRVAWYERKSDDGRRDETRRDEMR